MMQSQPFAAQQGELQVAADEAEQALARFREVAEQSQRSRAEEAEKARVALAALERRAVAAEENVQQLTERIARGEARIVVLEADVGEKQASLARLTDRVQDLTKDQAALEVFVGEAREREDAAATAQANLNRALGQLQQAQDELERARGERDGAAAQLVGINAQIKEAEAAAKGLDEKARAEVLLHEEAKAAREQDLERLQQRQKEQRDELTRLVGCAAKKRQLLAEHQELSKRLRKIFEQLDEPTEDEPAGPPPATPPPPPPTTPPPTDVQNLVDTPAGMRGVFLGALSGCESTNLTAADVFKSVPSSPRSAAGPSPRRVAANLFMRGPQTIQLAGNRPSLANLARSTDRAEEEGSSPRALQSEADDKEVEEEEQKADEPARRLVTDELAQQLMDTRMDVDEQDPFSGSDDFESASAITNITRLVDDKYLGLPGARQTQIRTALRLAEENIGHRLPLHARDIHDPLTHNEINNAWGSVLVSVRDIYMSQKAEPFKEGKRGVNKMAVAVYALDQWCRADRARGVSRREAEELLASDVFTHNTFDSFARQAGKQKKKKAGNK